MSKTKIAFVGCGHIAHVHMRYLRKLGKEVSVVCESSEPRAKEFVAKYGIKHYETQLQQLLENHKPTVVHVLVPPHLHYPITKTCLEHGCHVIVEKPLCETTTEYSELSDLANSNGLLLSVDHTRAYNPLLIKARSHLEIGRYREVVRLVYVSSLGVMDYSSIRNNRELTENSTVEDQP